MTVASWPDTLPQSPDNGGWNETLQQNVAAFQPEVGPPKYRRRSTASGALAQATFTMTAAQAATFMDFFTDTLADGSLPYSWSHPITGTAYIWMFEAPPSVSAQQYDEHSVSMQIRRLP